MQICAIISEYNPFHAGHARQIAEIRRQLPNCAVVAVMSGNYVQRGAPALWDKYQRAACAVHTGGADLILELPLGAALSSAENFARGGIQLIQALGCVTQLSFGCEHGTEESLLKLAAVLNSAEFDRCLQKHLQSGISYAQAAQCAAEQLCPTAAPLLTSPNDTLAVQYCRMLLRHCPTIEPLVVRRIGAAHDGTPQDGIPSASYIREKFLSGDHEAAFALIPSAYRERVRSARMHSWNEMEAAVLPYLRRLTSDDIATFPNVSEGLENRFYSACQTASSLEQLWEQTRSRRHPLSRVRRLTMCAYLGLTQEQTDQSPAFVSVLAMNERGRAVLRKMKTSCSLPVIIKPTQARKLTGMGAEQWYFTLKSDDLYHFPEPSGRDWKETPYILK